METRPAQLSASPTDMKRAVRERMRQQQPGLPTWRRSRRSSRGADGREGEGAVEQRRQQPRLPPWERGRRSSWRLLYQLLCAYKMNKLTRHRETSCKRKSGEITGRGRSHRCASGEIHPLRGDSMSLVSPVMKLYLYKRCKKTK
nr:uncharacterized protein LOC120965292 [Aegilops tauschii subsp. strangulata]